MTADTPCAGCPSPILAEAAPRVCELVIFDLRSLAVERVDEYHPGCWDAELRRAKATA